jgi:RNA polymerase sigma-70 factor
MDLAPASDDLQADRELAARAIAGDAVAVAAFEHRFRPELDRVVTRLGAHDDADELVQVLLTRMLVGDGERPARLTSWRGDGSLRSWVRAVSTRFVIDHLRGLRVRMPIAPLPDTGLAMSGGIEGGVEARRYADVVRTATEAAFAELSPRQRNLLRHATFHRLGIDELAAIYRVHRATTARWLQRTRDALHEAIAAKIATAACMPPDEALSLLRGAGEAAPSLHSVLSTALEPDD